MAKDEAASTITGPALVTAPTPGPTIPDPRTNPVASAAIQTVAAEAPAPETINAVKEIYFNAIQSIIGQSRDEATAFVNAMAPMAAVYLTRASNGDEQAKTLLDSIQRTAIMTAATYGIRLQQTHEIAFMQAVNVGFNLVLGPGGAALAQAAMALGTAVARGKTIKAAT